MSEAAPQVSPAKQKWVLIALAAIILYLLAKPWLEQKFNVKLPGLNDDRTVASSGETPVGPSATHGDAPAASSADLDQELRDIAESISLDGETTTVAAVETQTPGGTGDQPGTQPARTEKPKNGPSTSDRPQIAPTATKPRPTPSIPRNPPRDSTPQADPTPKTGGSTATKPASDASQPKLGQLKQVAGKVYQSTAGLRYGPGSADGHRLVHVMKHTEDNPDKPIHGVFTGTKEEVLALIDEAWLLVQEKSKQVKSEREEDRWVHTVDMKRKIGFTGGSVGQRKNHPVCYKLRIVVEGSDVITAFPTDR